MISIDDVDDGSSSNETNKFESSPKFLVQKEGEKSGKQLKAKLSEKSSNTSTMVSLKASFMPNKTKTEISSA